MNKKRVFISALSIAAVATVGTVFAATNSNTPAQAGEKPPIVITVENHEKRIGDLETKTDDIQTQVNQNSSDIKTNSNKPASNGETKVERVVTIIEKPAPLTEGDYPVTPNNPAPEPEPEPDPWTILRVYESRPANQAYPDTHVDLRCKYIFQNGQIGWSIGTVPKTSTSACSGGTANSSGSVMPAGTRAGLRFDACPF